MECLSYGWIRSVVIRSDDDERESEGERAHIWH